MRDTKQPVQTPGAPSDEDHETKGPAQVKPGKDSADKDAQIAKLQAELAAAQALNAKPDLPNVVYEPVTPHGKEKLLASDTANMTVAEVMQAIKDGTMSEPISMTLCRDGWYVRQN